VTIPPIDPSKIIWIKSVDRHSTPLWAYCGEDPAARHFEPQREGDEFDLHWHSRLRKNAQVPQRDEIICLIQDKHVTHLVQVLDDQPHPRHPEDHRAQSQGTNYTIARRVRALVMRGKGRAPYCRQALRFVPRLQGGPCCRVATLSWFRESRWPSEGGLAEFQRHLLRVLTGAVS
jgi:hypothetical protein